MKRSTVIVTAILSSVLYSASGYTQTKNPGSNAPLKSVEAHRSSGDLTLVGVRTVATAGEDRRLRYWKVPSLTMISDEKLPFEANSIVFSPKSKLLAIMGKDNRIVLRSLKGSSKTIRIRARPLSIEFSDDGKTLAVGCADGLVEVLNPLSGRELAHRQPDKRPITAIGFSRNASAVYAGFRDGTVTEFTILDGTLRPRRSVKLAYLPSSFGQLATGNRMLVSGLTKAPLVLDARSLKTRGALTGHENFSTNASVQPSLITGAWDGRIRKWSPDTLRMTGEVGRIRLDYITSVGETPDGDYCVSMSLGGELSVWSLSDKHKRYHYGR